VQLESNRLSDTPQIKPYSTRDSTLLGSSASSPPAGGRGRMSAILSDAAPLRPSSQFESTLLRCARAASGSCSCERCIIARRDVSRVAATVNCIDCFRLVRRNGRWPKGLNRGEVAQRGTQGLLQVPPVTPHRRDKREPFRGGVFFQAAVCETQTRAKRSKAARD